MATYTSTTPYKSGGSPLTYSWTDVPLVSKITIIKSEHMNQLRQVLKDAHLHYHTAGPRSTPATSVNSQQEDPNIPVAFVDDPVTANNTVAVKAAHVNELIGYIKSYEGTSTGGHRHNFPLFDYAGSVDVESSYYTEILTFDTDPVVTNTPTIKALAWTQLRTYLQDLTAHTHTVTCSCECTCTCTCTCQCTCTCECTCTNG